MVSWKPCCSRSTTERSQESLEKEKLSRWIWYNMVLGVVCGLQKEYTTLGKW